MKVTARNIILNSGEIEQQIRKWPPVLYILFLLIPIIGWAILLLAPYRRWRLLDTDQYSIEAKILKKTSEIEKLLSDRDKIIEVLKAEVADIKGSGRTKLREGRDYTIKISFWTILFGQPDDLDKPDKSWEDFLHPKVLGRKLKTNTFRESMGAPEHSKKQVHMKAYIPQELEQYQRKFTVDECDVEVVQDPNKQNQQGKKKSRGSNNNSATPPQQREGESADDYEHRLDAWQRKMNNQ